MRDNFMNITNLLAAASLFISIGTISYGSTDVLLVQRMLNQLGYKAGPTDGLYGKKTKEALNNFYENQNKQFDNKLDQNEINDLKYALQSIVGARKDIPVNTWNPRMDSQFTFVKSGFSAKHINTNLKWEPNNIAWKNSFITGNINEETVFRIQSQEGKRNEGNATDSADSKLHRHSRAEYKTKDTSLIKPGDKTTIEYSFYVPEEIEFSGHSIQMFGQTHGWHSDIHAWAVTTLPADETGHMKFQWQSDYDLNAGNLKNLDVGTLKEKDLVFSVRGILDAQGHPKFGTNVKLADAGKYQGQWNTITVTQTWGKEGAVKVVFNGKTVVDCTCDNSQSHSDYRSEDAEYGARELGYVFAFGIHRFLAQADKFKDVVDPIVYYKDVKVIKH